MATSKKAVKNILIPMRNMDPMDLSFSTQTKPLEIFYGTRDLLVNEKSVKWFNTGGAEGTVCVRLCVFFLSKIFAFRTRLGLPLEMVLNHKEECRTADVIFCRTDSISLAFLLAKHLGYVRGEVITLFQSVVERDLKYFGRHRFWFYLVKKLIGQAGHVLTLSNVAKDRMAARYEIDEKRISVFRFGIDLTFWDYHPWCSDRKMILSLGRDMNRDYGLLVRALADDHSLTIVTKKQVPHHKNLTIKRDLTYSEIASLYQAARLVVIPNLHLSFESAGLTTALQAMACGTPVIMADSPPMREYFSASKHIFFFKPECASSLVAVTREVYSDEQLLRVVSEQARQHVEDRFNILDTASQIREILIQKTGD